MNITIVLFTLFAILHLLYLKLFPCKYTTPRKLFAIFLDISAVSAIFGNLHQYGTPFGFLYLWIIFGNGVRFGISYLFFATFLAIIAMSIIYSLSPFWKHHTLFFLYIFFSIFILPLFIAKLLFRINKANDKLKFLLAKTLYQSTHDTLTDLLNRHRFDEILQEFASKKEPFALLFLDLDGFKLLNDTYGHHIGDQYLQEFAKLLKKVSTPTLIARLGGDEFALIAPLGKEEAFQIAHKIIDTIPTISSAIIHRTDIPVTVSIGIALFPEHTTDISLLKKYADEAMYAVKKKGKNDYKLYQTSSFS